MGPATLGTVATAPGTLGSFGAAQGPESGNCAGTVGTGGGGTVGTLGSFGAAQGPGEGQLRRHGGHRRRRYQRSGRWAALGRRRVRVSGNCAGTVGTGGGGTVGTLGSFGAAQGPVSGNCAGTVGTGGGGTVGTLGSFGAVCRVR